MTISSYFRIGPPYGHATGRKAGKEVGVKKYARKLPGKPGSFAYRSYFSKKGQLWQGHKMLKAAPWNWR
jgi:hypothetical protein